jgi:hypothetical protein
LPRAAQMLSLPEASPEFRVRASISGVWGWHDWDVIAFLE